MRLILIITLFINTLVACSEPNRILPGKRETVAEAFGLTFKNKNKAAQDNSLDLASMKKNVKWTGVSSAVSKYNSNIMLAEKFTEVWSVSIGKGDSKKKG